MQRLHWLTVVCMAGYPSRRDCHRSFVSILADWNQAAFRCVSSIARRTQMGIDDFKDTTPEFLPEEFFDAKVEGWAVPFASSKPIDLMTGTPIL